MLTRRRLCFEPVAHRAIFVGMLALAGCPGGDRLKLFLAPNGSEVIITLSEKEPPPW
jgi:hypothetical protein